MKLVDINGVILDIDKLCAIKKGKWSNIHQGWLAVAIMTGNVEIELGFYIREVAATVNALQMIEHRHR